VATSRRTVSKSAASKSSRGRDEASPRRRFVVFASLVAALTLTSALLLALAPESLRPDASRSLLAIGEPQSLDVLFDTTTPIQPGRWKYIFVHQSHTDSGDALSLAQTSSGVPDHFVIGNGQGCQDGEIQITQRWAQQDPPGEIAGLPRTQPNFVSICLVGDFDRYGPTPAQQRRLVQLITALQRQLGVQGQNVVFPANQAGIAGTGRNFPRADLAAQLLP
jgi:N-acetylmuramoyl-L-alanine amidase